MPEMLAEPGLEELPAPQSEISSELARGKIPWMIPEASPEPPKEVRTEEFAEIFYLTERHLI